MEFHSVTEQLSPEGAGTLVYTTYLCSTGSFVAFFVIKD